MDVCSSLSACSRLALRRPPPRLMPALFVPPGLMPLLGPEGAAALPLARAAAVAGGAAALAWHMAIRTLVGGEVFF